MTRSGLSATAELLFYNSVVETLDDVTANVRQLTGKRKLINDEETAGQRRCPSVSLLKREKLARVQYAGDQHARMLAGLLAVIVIAN